MSLFRVKEDRTDLECSRESISHAIVSVTFHAITVPLLTCLFSYGGGLNDVTGQRFIQSACHDCNVRLQHCRARREAKSLKSNVKYLIILSAHKFLRRNKEKS